MFTNGTPMVVAAVGTHPFLRHGHGCSGGRAIKDPFIPDPVDPASFMSRHSRLFPLVILMA